MIHAYNETYLIYVQKNVAAMCDIAVNNLGYAADFFGEAFATSDVAKKIESAHPDILAGKSATELLSLVLKKEVKSCDAPGDRSPEYWAGYILARVQWEYNISFEKIHGAVSLQEIIKLYSPYHEADDGKAVKIIKDRIPKCESILKTLRTEAELTQEELAAASGINVRSIRAYEQGKIELMNAQGDTLYMLAKALDTTIETLLIG